MKSFSWTWIAIIAVALLTVFTVYDFKREEKNDAAELKNKDALRLDRDKLVHIEIKNRDGGDIVLDKKDDKWRMTSPLDEPADEQTVQSFMMSLTGERITQTVADEGAGTNLETFGLTQPVKRLVLKTSDGKTEEVKIGTVKAYDGNLYGELDQDKKVYLLSSGWDPMLSKSVKDFRDKKVLRQDLKDTDIKSISIHDEAAPDIQLVQADKHWKFIKGGLNYPVADAKVSKFLNDLRNLRASEFEKVTGDEKAVLKAQHLDRPQIRIELFKDGKEPAFRLAIAVPPKPEGKKALENKDNPETKAPTLSAYSSDVHDLVKVAKTSIDALNLTAQDFYDRKVPFKFALADVAKIEVSVPGKMQASFAKSGNSWSVVKMTEPPEAADPKKKKVAAGTAITAALDKLNSLEAVRVLQVPPKGSVVKAMKNPARITLEKQTGEPVFVFNWGDLVVEKAGKDKPEAKYRVVQTDKADAVLGVADLDVTGLNPVAWVSDPSATPPVNPVVKPRGNSTGAAAPTAKRFLQIPRSGPPGAARKASGKEE